MTTSNSIDWQIESIRVTTFLNGPLNPSLLETWLEKVSGNSPLQVNKTISAFDGISKSSDGFLRTTWRSNRLDVTISSEDSQIGQTIAPVAEAQSLFSRYVDSLPEIGDLVLVDRIAVGLVLSFQVASEPEGIRLLSGNIVSLNPTESSRDFLYRVNHPSSSRFVDGLKINRLATWSVGKRRVIRHQVNTDGSQDDQIISEAPLAIRLELDINTDETFQLGFELVKLKNVLDELMEIAENIAIAGETIMLQ